jgi:hypothetical protein
MHATLPLIELTYYPTPRSVNGGSAQGIVANLIDAARILFFQQVRRVVAVAVVGLA